MIRNILASVGFCVLVLYFSAQFGVGNFRFYYGPAQVTCTH